MTFLPILIIVLFIVVAIHDNQTMKHNPHAHKLYYGGTYLLDKEKNEPNHI